LGGTQEAITAYAATLVTPIASTYAEPFPAGRETPSITVHFGPGPKTNGDNLSFVGDGSPDCSDELGLFDCTTPPTSWRWNVEIEAHVGDDASKWLAKQSMTLRKKGFWSDLGDNLHSFDISENHPKDGPESFALQQPAGQKTIFWIDDPGHGKSLSFLKAIDSITQIQNFTSTICSKQNASVCINVQWFVKLVVKPGEKLDRQQSKAGLGTLSTNF
jgi:hypothetical protein